MRIPETINETELQSILKLCRKTDHKIAFALGFYEGLRISEVTKLKPEDIDKGRRTIHIKSSKFGKDRIIPIAPQVMRGLKHLPVKCGIRALQIAFKTKAKKVLDKDLYFHCLRHSAATYYLNTKKWNLRQVQQLLGHSRVNTTQIYTHVTPNDLINIMWGED